MKNPKVIVGLVLIGLILIVFLQNRETVDTKILFFTVTMSRAGALGLTFLIGFASGGLLVGLRKRRARGEGASDAAL